MIDETAAPKDLSWHIFHGRVWVNAKDAAAALVVAAAAVDDLAMQHDWLNDRLYEITVSGTTAAEVRAFVTTIKKSLPSARIAVATCSGVIMPSDWHVVKI